MTTIKVRLAVTLEVDAETWALNYGTSQSAAEIRADVREYFTNVLGQATEVVRVS